MKFFRRLYQQKLWIDPHDDLNSHRIYIQNCGLVATSQKNDFFLFLLSIEVNK